jgi:hypothetical protein
LPLAISSAVWSSFGGLRWPQLSEQRIHSSSLASRESYPAVPSRPATADQLLSWASRPFSTCRNRGSTSRGFCLPATFRLQGLVTLLTVSAPRFRAGLVSYRQRSWDSPCGAFASRKVSDSFPSGRTHLPFRLTVYPHRSARPARQTAAPGLQPFRKSLTTRRAVNTLGAGCSLGFCPSRACHEHLGKDFASPPLTRFPDPNSMARTAASQSINRHPLRPTLRRGRPRGSAGATLLGFSHRPAS